MVSRREFTQMESTLYDELYVEYFVTELTKHIEYFKAHTDFGWYQKNYSESTGIFEILDPKLEIISNITIKPLPLKRFDDALLHYASKTGQSSEVLKSFSQFSVMRELLRGAPIKEPYDWKEIDFPYAAIVAIYIVSQSHTDYCVRVDTGSDAMNYIKIIPEMLALFQDSSVFSYIVNTSLHTICITMTNGQQKRLTMDIAKGLTQDEKEKEERLIKYDQACEILIKAKESFPHKNILQQIRSTLIKEKFKLTSFATALECARFDESLFVSCIAIIMVSQLPTMLNIYTHDATQLLHKVEKEMAIFKDTESFGWRQVAHIRSSIKIENNKSGAIATLVIISIESPKRKESSFIHRFNKAYHYLRRERYHVWYNEDLLLFDKTYATLDATTLKEEEFLSEMMKSCYHRQVIFRAFVTILIVSNVGMDLVETKHENPNVFIRDVYTYLKYFKNYENFDWTIVNTQHENELTLKNHSQSVTLRVLSIEDYEKHEKEMDAMLKLCQERLKPGQYMELSEKDYPYLEKMECFLRSKGYWLSTKTFGHRFMITMPL